MKWNEHCFEAIGKFNFSPKSPQKYTGNIKQRPVKSRLLFASPSSLFTFDCVVKPTNKTNPNVNKCGKTKQIYSIKPQQSEQIRLFNVFYLEARLFRSLFNVDNSKSIFIWAAK